MSVTTDLSLLAAVAVALCSVLTLFAVLLLARATAFSRHIDRRRLRRAKFQDEWAQIIRAAGDYARFPDRRSK